MKYFLASFIYFINYYIIALGISDFEFNNIKTVEILHSNINDTVKTKCCYNYMNSTKIRSENKIFNNNNNYLNQDLNNFIGRLSLKPIDTVNQISLQDQTLRDVLNKFSNNYLISVQPVKGLDMSLGTNQLKFNYKY
jgi:hypothetical protein